MAPGSHPNTLTSEKKKKVKRVPTCKDTAQNTQKKYISGRNTSKRYNSVVILKATYRSHRH